MKPEFKEEISAHIKMFHMPRYSEIPDVGLFLEQTTKFVAEYLSPLQSLNITSSMISNYVKKKLIANPVKKQYYRDQIAYILFIAIAKSVLSLEDIQTMIHLQNETHDCKEAYEYFCREFENVLYYVFGLTDNITSVEDKDSDEKILLRNTIITIAHKIYLDECFRVMNDSEKKK